MSRRRRAVTRAATVIGTAAALVAGYATAGATGLIDVAALATLGVLIAARGAVRGEEPRSVRTKKRRRDPARRPAVRAADFPAYALIATDVEWARMSQRHYEHALRPRLARLAAALGRPGAIDLTGPADPDGPGPDLATLERIVTHLETP
ncbi:MAG TPA: hypothetical protein VGS06_02050 [Streptosporangiaceae bacterium]|nr:hypothetical protein [Streptosporangiaceae bacterium]